MVRWILLALLLAGCSSKIPECKGPVVPLNAGNWVPTAEDLRRE